MKAEGLIEEQIISLLKKAESRTKVMDVCRKYGISDATYYNWKAKYQGTELTYHRLKPMGSYGLRMPRRMNSTSAACRDHYLEMCHLTW